MKRWIIFIIIPLAIGIIASATGFSLVWRLFILSIMVPVISYLWSFFNIMGVRGETMPLPARSHVGDILENHLRLINSQHIPKLMLKVQENTDFPGHSNISVANLFSKSSSTIQSKILCSIRGLFCSGSYTVTVSDPLGFFPRSCVIGEPQNVLVYPNTVELPFFDPLTYIEQGYSSGRWLEFQTSPNVASIREYVNGDSLKHIHWRTTAHSTKLMVKVFDPDRSHSQAKTIWIVLDMCHSVQSGTGLNSTEEYSVTIAASIVKKFIENGWPVGLITSAEKPYRFPLQTGNYHLEMINTGLATMKAQGEIPIEQFIATEASHFDLNTMLIIITPSWNEKLTTPLLQIKSQQGVAVVILLDTSSFSEAEGRSIIPRQLVLNRIQTYVVRKGDHLATVLDSRNLSKHTG